MPPRWVRVRRGYSAPGVHGSGLAPRLEHRSSPSRDRSTTGASHVVDADAARPDYDLEDDDCFDVAGHETVYRRFGHTVSGVPVLSDEWLWVVDGVAHLLLGTVAAEDYEDYCDVFESVAETFDPDWATRDFSQDRCLARLGLGVRRLGSLFGLPTRVRVWLTFGLQAAGHR